MLEGFNHNGEKWCIATVIDGFVSSEGVANAIHILYRSENLEISMIVLRKFWGVTELQIPVAYTPTLIYYDLTEGYYETVDMQHTSH
jgi:hypothetical protein